MKNLKLNLLITALILILSACNSSSSGSSSDNTTLASGFYTGTLKVNNILKNAYFWADAETTKKGYGVFNLENSEKTTAFYTYTANNNRLNITAAALSINGTTNSSSTGNGAFLNIATGRLYKDEEKDNLLLTATPSDADIKNHTWTLDFNSIYSTITIDNNLVLTLSSKSNCTITVQLYKTNNYWVGDSVNKTAGDSSCTLDIINPYNYKKFYLGYNPKTPNKLYTNSFGVNNINNWISAYGVYTKN